MPTVYCACGEKFVVAEEHIGRRIQCGKCGRRFEITRPPEPEPRRSQQQRDPYRDSSYRSEPPRDPYRETRRDDPYRRNEPPSRRDDYREDYRDRPRDSYRDDRDSYRRDDDGYDDDRPRETSAREKLEQVSGFLTPKLRLLLFLAFAGLALLSAALILSTMKPSGNTLPAAVPDQLQPP